MAKKKIIKKEFTPSPKNEKDTVVFMAVYDIHKIKRRFFRFRKRKKKGLWSCHYTVESYLKDQSTPLTYHLPKKKAVETLYPVL